MPCVEGILPDIYLEHFSLLSEATYILLGDAINPASMLRAEQLLEKFYKSFAELYGEGSCGLNIHNAGQHLVYFCDQWGPHGQHGAVLDLKMPMQ